MPTLHPSDDPNTDIAMPSPRHKDFSTGQAAKIIGVSSRTIVKCIDNGTIQGYRIPSDKENGWFRRIPWENLRKFMVDNNIPLTLLPHDMRLDDSDSARAQEVVCTNTFDLGAAMVRGNVRRVVITNPALFHPEIAQMERVDQEQYIRAYIARVTGEAGIVCPEVVFEPCHTSLQEKAA